MATRSATVSYGVAGQRAALASWTGLLNGDDGSPVDMLDYGDRSIQFQGTFGTGGSIQLEGSNDGTNWQLLTDPQGNDIIKTSADLEAVTEVTRYVRPRVTAGDGTTALVATLFARRG